MKIYHDDYLFMSAADRPPSALLHRSMQMHVVFMIIKTQFICLCCIRMKATYVSLVEWQLCIGSDGHVIGPKVLSNLFVASRVSSQRTTPLKPNYSLSFQFSYFAGFHSSDAAVLRLIFFFFLIYVLFICKSIASDGRCRN